MYLDGRYIEIIDLIIAWFGALFVFGGIPIGLMILVERAPCIWEKCKNIKF